MVKSHFPPAFGLQAHDLAQTPSTQSRSPSSSSPALLIIVIRCPHRQRTAYPTASARPPPTSASVRRRCLWVKNPSSPLALILLELHHVVRDGCISEEAFVGHTQYRSENHVEQQWNEHPSLPETLPHVERFRTLSII